MLLANLLEKIAFFLLLLLIARNFTESIFGYITASFAFANITIAFFEFGFNFYFQREVAADTPELSQKFAHAFSLRIITFILYSIVICSYYFTTTTIELFFPAVLLGFAVFIYSINNLLNAILFGKNDYRSAFFALLFSRVILFITVFGGIYLGGNLLLTVLGFVIGGISHFVFLIGVLQKYNLHIKLLMPQKKILAPILASSSPIALGIVFVWLYDRGDVILLRQFRGDEILALYAVAYSVYKLPQAFANFIFNPMFSEFSQAFSVSGYLTAASIKKYSGFLSLILLLVIAGIFFTKTSIVQFLYGAPYHPAAEYIPYLLAALPALFGNNFTGLILNSVRLEKQSAKTVMYAAAINILFNMALIPRFGIYGCVFTTILTEYITFFGQIIYIVKHKIIKSES